jgi:putrescine transport system substrate-binding protein
MLDAPAEMIPAALNYPRHRSRQPSMTDEIDKAKAEHLVSIRPSIQKFHSSEYINALANGDICLAMGWSGDVLQARDRAAEADNGVDRRIHHPAEGAQMWFDQMAIPSDAANPRRACLPQLHHEAGEHGEGVELRLLRQRQRRLQGIPRTRT